MTSAAAVLAGLARDLSNPRVPASTYRVQFGGHFTFDDARRRVPYLNKLGVDALYASPYLKARPESTHGYDVSDHSQLNPAIGDDASQAALSEQLRRLGMGQILDTVPNHMGIGEPSNVWWMDVLENGPSSIYADYFDVEWRPHTPELENRVLLPILGGQYGRVLEDQELRLAFEDGAFFVCYWETKLPISPRSYNRVLLPALERLGGRDEDDPNVLELESIATSVRNLPEHAETDPERRRERHREKEVVKRRLAALVARDPEIGRAIEAGVAEMNGVRGDPSSFDALDDLLRAQSYRLAYWRVASEEINYRRFFDVNDLAALRMEHPEVFAAAHQLIFRLLDQGRLTGLRIDHPDGLWDPAAYLEQLQTTYLLRLARARAGLDPDEGEPAFDGEARRLIAGARERGDPWATRPLYVVVEKILAPREPLPEGWPVAGTVGYEYLNALGGVFVDGANRRRFDAVYARFVGQRFDYDDLIYDSKQLIMRVALASEVNALALRLDRVSEQNRLYRDFTLYALRSAVREVIACLPVYRTYVTERTREVSERDRGYVETAVGRARRRNPAFDPTIFEFLRDLLLLRVDGEGERAFVMRFQQTTGPVAAKGVEDTAFYVFNRLTSLNEVGGEPDQFGNGLDELHRLNQERLERWPGGLSTTSTHDTKRSEDVRARISVLSELPGEWSAALTRWSRLNRRKRRTVDGRPAPDRNEEYLLYQTLLGVWPLDEQPTTDLEERVVAYMGKATREAKVNTSWLNPNEAWDEALAAFAGGLLRDEVFLTDFVPFQRRVAGYGMYNALAQVLLKIASPGVPDVYQGQELWDLSLVDPDNRRPVDFDLRARMLDEMLHRRPRPGNLLASWRDGRIKLWLTHRALSFRRDHQELFARGAYSPLAAHGERAECVVAFARTLGAEALIALAPRLTTRLTDDPALPPLGERAWSDTALEVGEALRGGRYRDVITGEDVRAGKENLRLADACRSLPFALLERVA